MAEIDRQTIDLICYDFDGVMTDNRVMVHEDGTESVVVNRSDGLAVSAMRRMGLRQLILSTETNSVVAARARKLDIPCIHGSADKRAALLEYADRHGVALDRTVYIGNDVNDLGAMRLVGHPVAPGDAHERVREIAVFITKAKGGEGVVREFFETFLDEKDAV